MPLERPHPKLSHSFFQKVVQESPADGTNVLPPSSNKDSNTPPITANPKEMEPSLSNHSPSAAAAAASPNARSKSISTASSADTKGALNCHPLVTADAAELATIRVGVSEDRNRRCRRTMEDAHSFVYDFAGIPGQGYFAVFDGHAGKHAAEWCGAHFHEFLLHNLNAQSSKPLPIPEVLNKTFLDVDNELSKLANAEKTHSGCTAVVAFLRLEDDDDGRKSSSSDDASAAKVHSKSLENVPSREEQQRVNVGGLDPTPGPGEHEDDAEGGVAGSKREKVRSVLGKLTGKSTTDDKKNSSTESSFVPVVRKIDAKRVLYTANVGDARAVISRRGKAVRLTYDHKGSDQQEAKRITDAGGFVMNNRVNGVLAVTRALGDASVKEFVVGNPYTTETRLDDGDEFLIVACDGLWDVTEDQEAVDLIRNVADPQVASKILLDHALGSFSTDNLSVLVVRLGPNLG